MNIKKPFKRFEWLIITFGDTNEYTLLPYKRLLLDDEGNFTEIATDSKYNTTLHGDYSKILLGTDHDITVARKEHGGQLDMRYKTKHIGCDQIIFKDVELFTAFVIEDRRLRLITWDEWNAKYSPELTYNSIKDPLDDRLKEHGSDLVNILNILLHDSDSDSDRFEVECNNDKNEYSISNASGKHVVTTGAHSKTVYNFTYYDNAIGIAIKVVVERLRTASDNSKIFPPLHWDDQVLEQCHIIMKFDSNFNIDSITFESANNREPLSFIKWGHRTEQETVYQIIEYLDQKLIARKLRSIFEITEGKFETTGNITFEPISENDEKRFAIDKSGNIYNQIMEELMDIFDTEPYAGRLHGMDGDSNYHYDIRLKTTELLSFKDEIINLGIDMSDGGHHKITIKISNSNELLDHTTIALIELVFDKDLKFEWGGVLWNMTHTYTIKHSRLRNLVSEIESLTDAKNKVG